MVAASAVAAVVLLAPAPGGAASGGVGGVAGAGYPSFSGTRTVSYCREGGRPQPVTLFAPRHRHDPVPVVVQVHGGGWHRGSRLRSLRQSATARRLVDEGLVVASVGYRLAPAHPWPDQIVDVECAVRFLHADARRLGIDADRIGAWGSSAGGQLVSLLATAHGGPGWGAGPYRGASERLAAVVDEFGPSDLTQPQWPPYTRALIRRVFGHVPGPSPVLASASPVTYVAAGDPPFLILQGTADRIVPAAQSEELARRLTAAHDAVRLVLVHGGAHGLGTPGERPRAAALSRLIAQFLGRQLGPS